MAEPLTIYYSNPFRSDKNIGKAYNDFIKKLSPNDDDWIVLQDGDMMYLTPDWGKRIEDALRLDGHKFGIVGCYTNRLNSVNQLHGRKLSEDFNIKNHHDISLGYNEEGIEPFGHIVAGMFMAFQYKTWKMVGGFVEKNISCDAIFNQMIFERGMTSGLIRSLYVFHLYRIWADKDPRNERKHLH